MTAPANEHDLLAEALKRCESEQIHLVGAIQGYGVLLAIDGSDVVRMASDNLDSVFGIPAAQAIGRPANQLIDDQAIQSLRLRLQGMPDGRTIPQDCHAAQSFGGANLLALAHLIDELLIIELKPARVSKADAVDRLLEAIRESMWYFDRETSIDGYCRLIANELRRITGFDRVKVYRFDNNWNGEVIAESRNGSLPTLLNHHFPARDIPPQARALYEKNLVRILADSEAPTVPVIPVLNPLNNRPLDLSHSVLRAISPIHIEYLRNMGVRSTITVSLMHDGRLWGLVACHNATPKHVPGHLRELIEFIGKTVSMKLGSLENAARANSMEAVRQRLQTLTELVRSSSDIHLLISRFSADYLSLADASGSYASFGDSTYEIGLVPRRTELMALVTWLKQQPFSNGIFVTDRLGDLFAPAGDYASLASGLLAVALDPELNSFILWFRREVERDIVWAGNPDSKVVLDALGPRVDPRRSFEVWLETARGRSEPWTHASIDAVKLFSLSIVQMLMQQSLQKVNSADAANKAKGEFLANMSHEIRTPMNAIIGLAYLCLQTEVSPQQRDYLEKVNFSANNLLRILNDILDFSKIEAGRMSIEETSFGLDRVLENVGTLTALQAQEKDIEFIVDVAPGCPVQLWGDPLRLEQVLVNLADNAVKFTEKGEIVMAVWPVAESAADFELSFSVSDTGIGMTLDQMGRLFQPFTQADGSTTRKFGGSGLGLSICRRLVEMMGGSIDATSEPGRGTQFTFTARFRKHDDDQISRRAQIGEVMLPDLRDLSVLLVDDSSRARGVCRQYLESFAFKVTEAASGNEALGLNAERQRNAAGFDLIVIDREMPGLDGIETARRISESAGAERRPKTILTSMHGHVYRHDEHPFVDAILAKPFTASRLFNTIAGMYACAGLTSVSGGSDADKNHIRGAHLLLTEDNEINQQVAKQILEGIGVRVTVASDGEAAVMLTRAHRFDGILMDVHMPVMDGYAATRRIREDLRFSDLPIIAMTANAMSGDREKCLAAGMNDHIAKPVNPEELFATLARWVTPAQPAEAAAVTTASTRSARPDQSMPRLPGMQVDAAVQRLGGDVNAYLGLLDRFRRNHRDSIAEIRLALTGGSRPLAERTAHTLKSVAATLGAVGLAEKASDIEIHIREGVKLTRMERLLESTRAELNALLAAIDKLLSAGSEPAAGDPNACDHVPSLLSSALRLLAAYDTGAEEPIAAMEKLLPRTGPIALHMAHARECLDRYDYEAARTRLLALARELDLSDPES
jgi:polar amino acid transport system substrate-binding protein